jgi:hypothetical protein
MAAVAWAEKDFPYEFSSGFLTAADFRLRSLDHLIRPAEQIRVNLNAYRFRRF